MKVGIVNFLGTNCDRDCLFACDNLGVKAEIIQYTQTNLKNFDCIVLPGGFSYGDYLRSGALAKFSPIMRSIKEFAEFGGYVMGICNGFQVLIESGLLPGALLKNNNLRFIHKYVYLKIEHSQCFFTKNIDQNTILKMPIAHGEGNYYCSRDTMKYINDNNMVVLRYSSKNGEILQDCNPNGSLENIAGICSKKGNVFGLMPHPERVVGDLGNDGEQIWNSLVS